MVKPSRYEKFHWAVFNMGAKIFASGLVVVCFVFILLVAANVYGKPIGDGFPPWILVLFVPLLVVGVLMVRAKPYYPEKYKEWYESKRKQRV